MLFSGCINKKIQIGQAITVTKGNIIGLGPLKRDFFQNSRSTYLYLIKILIIILRNDKVNGI